MTDKADELKKLVAIAGDRALPADLRIKAMEMIGNTGTHDALLALLELAANEALIKEERDLALKHSREIIKSGR